jgi:hypothetical protein
VCVSTHPSFQLALVLENKPEPSNRHHSPPLLLKVRPLVVYLLSDATSAILFLWWPDSWDHENLECSITCMTLLEWVAVLVVECNLIALLWFHTLPISQ